METATLTRKPKGSKQTVVQSAKQTTSPSTLPRLSKEEFARQVNVRAYQYYVERGASHGAALADWLRAEKELRVKYHIEN